MKNIEIINKIITKLEHQLKDIKEEKDKKNLINFIKVNYKWFLKKQRNRIFQKKQNLK